MGVYLNPEDEENLEETVRSALKQVEEKNYSASLIAEGFSEEKIRRYGFAFEGKKVRIDGGDLQKVKEIMNKAGKKPARNKPVRKKAAKKAVAAKKGNVKGKDLY